ncbi:MAG TPA: hypothetical protein VEI06_07905 [Gemmatimonadaceae bacterium]|nr:hypothetical protein [Gemmatimonadaceae bacterium]
MTDLLFWLAVVCCAAAQAVIVRSAVRAPLEGGGLDGVPRPRRAAELLWTLLPAAFLGGVLALTWRAIHGS